MILYLDVITGSDRVRDTEGAEFSDAAAACAEALQCAREQAAELLKSGKTFPADWHIEILDNEGAVLATVFFSELISQPTTSMPLASAGDRLDRRWGGVAQHHRRSHLLVVETRALAADLKATCNDLFQSLAAIGK